MQFAGLGPCIHRESRTYPLPVALPLPLPSMSTTSLPPPPRPHPSPRLQPGEAPTSSGGDVFLRHNCKPLQRRSFQHNPFEPPCIPPARPESIAGPTYYPTSTPSAHPAAATSVTLLAPPPPNFTLLVSISDSELSSRSTLGPARKQTGTGTTRPRGTVRHAMRIRRPHGSR